MTREHFSYAMTLDVPVFIIINKIDLCSRATIQQIVTCLEYFLKHNHSKTQIEPFLIQKEEDLVKGVQMFVEKR